MKIDDELFMSMIQIELMINSLKMNQLENMSWWIGLRLCMSKGCKTADDQIVWPAVCRPLAYRDLKNPFGKVQYKYTDRHAKAQG